MYRFRCIRCGAQYDSHSPFCSGCWSIGQIVLLPHRNYADADYQPGVSTARDVARMNWGSVAQHAYPDLHLGTGALVEVSGAPGSGKSTFAARLVDAIPGPGLLMSAEEGISPTLAARLARCQVRRSDFHIVSRATVDQVVALATSKKVVGLIVDSVHECCWAAADLRHLLTLVPTLSTVVAVMQVNKSGAPAGAMALLHEADVHVVVESMTWRLTKSRYQALEGVAGDVLTAPVTTGPMPVEMEDPS